MTEKTPDKIEVPLTVPIVKQKKDGKEEIIDKLILHRIKLKSFRGLPSEDSTLPLKTFLIAASAQMPVEIIEEIDYADVDFIMEALDPFLTRSPLIGKI